MKRDELRYILMMKSTEMRDSCNRDNFIKFLVDIFNVGWSFVFKCQLNSTPTSAGIVFCHRIGQTWNSLQRQTLFRNPKPQSKVPKVETFRDQVSSSLDIHFAIEINSLDDISVWVSSMFCLKFVTCNHFIFHKISSSLRLWFSSQFYLLAFGAHVQRVKVNKLSKECE